MSENELDEAQKLGLPELPFPACTFADHSYRAYTKAQLIAYAQAALNTRTPITPSEEQRALADVAAERRRQVEVEGWTPEHDDGHPDGALARAAACYAWAAHSIHPIFRKRMADAAFDHADDIAPIKRMWPWDWKWWKPKDRRHDLIRAAALIVAEIERLDRLALLQKVNHG